MNILRFTIFLVITLFFLNSAFASFPVKKGIKAGLNITSSSGNLVETEYKNGFTGGLFLCTAISRKLFIQPELLFSAKGYKFEAEFFDGKVTFNYIELPIIIKVWIFRQTLKNSHLYLGPVVSYNISATYKTTIYDSRLTGDIENINKLDYGLIFGCNWGFSDNIFIDLRYNLSLNDWDSINKGYKHRVISIILNYIF